MYKATDHSFVSERGGKSYNSNQNQGILYFSHLQGFELNVSLLLSIYIYIYMAYNMGFTCMCKMFG